MENEKLESVLKVAGCTKPETTLWTKKEITVYLGISTSGLESLLKKGVFIDARINISGTREGKRWIAKDVIDWAISTQYKQGRPRNVA